MHSTINLIGARATTAALFALTLGLSATCRADDLASLVAGTVEQVVTECAFTEGPAWHPDGYLLFSDIPNRRIIRVNQDGTFSDWLTESGGANGLICDQAGNVYACQGAEKRIARLRGAETGSVEAVITSEFEGLQFNQPNDLALDGQGGLYFTDPNYSQDPPTQPEMGVYYVSPQGAVSRVLGANDFPRPNGVLVTPDGKSLIVASIEERKIIRYEITGSGELGEGQVLFTGDEELDGGGPDGMALDSDGRIYATYKSVVVLSAEGEFIGRIEIPEKPANCTLGGPEGNILYITARTSLYSVPMNVTAPPLMATGPQGTAGTREVEALELTLQIPTNWEEETPSSNLRLLQFKLPAVEEGAEPTEYVVFPPFGGSREENISRWVAQFEAEGRQLAMVVGTCEQGEYVQVDLTGTYKKPDGPPVRMQTVAAPGYRMLAVILSTANGNYFIKMVGPSATIDASVAAFRESFGADASTEMEYTLP